MFNFWIPAASTAAAFIALLAGRAVAACVHDRGPMSPGLTGLRIILCIR